MRIKSLMISEPIAITEKASIQEALEIMKRYSIRHLPVVATGNILKGLVTLADLRAGLMPSLVANISLADLMIKEPITVDPEEPIETAAQLSYNYKISGIPVVAGTKLVGIITESDILRAFIDMMGILTASSRIDVELGEKSGTFEKALQIIHENGGDIINIGMTARQNRKRTYYFRLAACKTDEIRSALEKQGYRVIDAMD